VVPPCRSAGCFQICENVAIWFQAKLKIIGDNEPTGLIYGTKTALIKKITVNGTTMEEHTAYCQCFLGSNIENYQGI
jgi:hypothetical protein